MLISSSLVLYPAYRTLRLALERGGEMSTHRRCWLSHNTLCERGIDQKFKRLRVDLMFTSTVSAILMIQCIMFVHHAAMRLAHGERRLGSRGNRDALLMFSKHKKSMTTRSSPTSSSTAIRFKIYLIRLTDTTSTMGRGAKAEGVEVSLHTCRVNSCDFHPLCQEIGIVNSLSTG